MAAQRADVETVKRKRGQEFVIEDTKAYVDAANKMRAMGIKAKLFSGFMWIQ